MTFALLGFKYFLELNRPEPDAFIFSPIPRHWLHLN